MSEFQDIISQLDEGGVVLDGVNKKCRESCPDNTPATLEASLTDEHKSILQEMKGNEQQRRDSRAGMWRSPDPAIYAADLDELDGRKAIYEKELAKCAGPCGVLGRKACRITGLGGGIVPPRN